MLPLDSASPWIHPSLGSRSYRPSRGQKSINAMLRLWISPMFMLVSVNRTNHTLHRLLHQSTYEATNLPCLSTHSYRLIVVLVYKLYQSYKAIFTTLLNKSEIFIQGFTPQTWILEIIFGCFYRWVLCFTPLSNGYST